MSWFSNEWKKTHNLDDANLNRWMDGENFRAGCDLFKKIPIHSLDQLGEQINEMNDLIG